MASKEKLEALVTAIGESMKYTLHGELIFGHISNELLDVLEADANFTDEMKDRIYDASEPEA
tara:strand:- start:559 stop:744 length:186 start_codon:yes stop_codon:yes gene_type:complete